MMRDEDAGVLPIVDGDRLAADRPTATSSCARRRGQGPEHDDRRRDRLDELVTVDPEQSLDEAMRLMAEHQVRRLPVTEEDGRLVGILSQRDVARATSDKDTGRVVEEISR